MGSFIVRSAASGSNSGGLSRMRSRYSRSGLGFNFSDEGFLRIFACLCSKKLVFPSC
jgi:hypothetical protein